MKIGLVCPYNIYKGGGVQECVLALKAEYQRLGHKAYIITPRPIGIEAHSDDGILLVGTSTDFKSPFHTTAQVSVAFDSTAIDELLQNYNFDILHFHEPWVPMVSRQILSSSNVPNIATFHAKLPETMMSRTIERVITPYTKSILKYIDGFSAVSDAAAEYIQSLSKKSVDIIPNGIDLDKFTQTRALKPTPLTILFIGRLERRKGVMYLLKAFNLLQSTLPDVRLTIAGDGPEKEKLQNFVIDNEISNVEFLGYIDESQKIKLLQKSAIFCSPAVYGESFGIVLLEAMAAGTVIVAGDNPGYVGVMKDTGQISIVNPKDTEEFTRRLSLLLTDVNMRQIWVKWAKDYVKQYNYQIIAKMYLTMYKKVIKSK